MTGFDLGGGGGNSFSFGPQGSQPGASVTGTVLDMKEVQETNYDTKEPEFWPNGDPKMQFRLTLQTDLRNPDNPGDDGKRDVYLSGYRKAHPKTGTSGTLYAVLEAVGVATGSAQLKYGGKLTLQWVSGMGFTGDPRHYQAWYEAPAMDLQQPVEHRSPAPPPAAPQIGSQAANPGPPPAWAQTQPVPAAAPVPVAQVPAAQAPAVTPQAAPAQAAWGTPPAPATAATGTDQWSRPLTAAEVAAARNAGIDPAAVYGADYEQRVTA